MFESEHLKKTSWFTILYTNRAINELTVLSNLETHNAQMIREGISKTERFQILKEIADYQINILASAENIKYIQENA